MDRPRPAAAPEAGSAPPPAAAADLMLAGHFGVGLGLKARFPSVALAPILLAAELPDLLFVLLQAIGWETLGAQAVPTPGAPQAEAVPAVRALGHAALGSAPFSHDLAMVAIYAGLTASLGLLLVSSRWALALGIAVFSHVLLDVLVQPPVIGVCGPWLPIHIGADLWRQSPLLGWSVEMLVVVGGGALYLRAQPGRGGWRAWAAPALLVAVHVAAVP